MGKKVYLCRGSGCKKRKTENKKIRNSLDGSVSVEEVRCQKICKGPVVGVKVDGILHWFRKLDGKSDLVELQKAVTKGRLSKKLAAKEAAKRAGKMR